MKSYAACSSAGAEKTSVSRRPAVRRLSAASTRRAVTPDVARSSPYRTAPPPTPGRCPWPACSPGCACRPNRHQKAQIPENLRNGPMVRIEIPGYTNEVLRTEQERPSPRSPTRDARTALCMRPCPSVLESRADFKPSAKPGASFLRARGTQAQSGGLCLCSPGFQSRAGVQAQDDVPVGYLSSLACATVTWPWGGGPSEGPPS